MAAVYPDAPAGNRPPRGAPGGTEKIVGCPDLTADKTVHGRVEVAFALVEGPVPDALDEPYRRAGDAPRRVVLEGGGGDPVLRAADDEGAGTLSSTVGVRS